MRLQPTFQPPGFHQQCSERNSGRESILHFWEYESELEAVPRATIYEIIALWQLSVDAPVAEQAEQRSANWKEMDLSLYPDVVLHLEMVAQAFQEMNDLQKHISNNTVSCR